MRLIQDNHSGLDCIVVQQMSEVKLVKNMSETMLLVWWKKDGRIDKAVRRRIKPSCGRSKDALRRDASVRETSHNAAMK